MVPGAQITEHGVENATGILQKRIETVGTLITLENDYRMHKILVVVAQFDYACLII